MKKLLLVLLLSTAPLWGQSQFSGGGGGKGGVGSLPTAAQPGQIITSTAAGTTYAVQGSLFYSQSSDTISSIESECSSACTYVVTGPQTFTLAADHTLSSNVRVEFKAAGLWTVNGAFTLTIPSNVSGPPTQHFAGTSTIRIGAGTSVVYAEWFGAVGDGTTDDSTAIESAIQSLYGTGADGSNDGHGNVQLLAKTYKIGTGLTITHGGVSLIGVNQGASGSAGPIVATGSGFVTALTTASASLTMLSVSGTSSSWISDNQIREISLERSVTPTGTSTGVSITYAWRTLVNHVTVYDAVRGFYLANMGNAGSGITYSGVFYNHTISTSGPYYGFYIDETGSNVTPSLYMNHVLVALDSAGPTVYGFYATGAHIEDIQVEHLETAKLSYGIYLNSTGSAFYANSDNFFTNNVHDGCLVSCYYITGMSNSGTSSVTINGGWMSGVNATPEADIESSNGVMFSGVNIASTANNNTMFKISGGGTNTILGNNFATLNTNTIGILLNNTASDVVSSNIMHSGFSGATAIELIGSSNNVITGNSVSGTLSTGISFDGTSNTNEAYPNVLIGASTQISDSGTGNVTGGFLTNPMTTLGDLVYGSTAGAPARLAGNTTSSLNVLTQTGTGSVSAAPGWQPLTGTSPINVSGTTISCPTCSTSSSSQTIFTIANDGTTGTTLNKLVKLAGVPSTAIITSTADTGGTVGICVGGCGTTGSATIQDSGTVTAVFDGATTAGDYVQNSSTTAGDAHDAGSTYPTSGQVIGRVLSTNAAAGNYNIDKFPSELQASAGGGGSTSKVLSATDVTSSRAAGTVYHNTSGADMLVQIGWSATGTATATVFSDSAATPTTPVAVVANSSGYAIPVLFVVQSGNYYELSGTNIGTIFRWYEMKISKGSITDSGDISASRAFSTVYQNTGSTVVLVEAQISGSATTTAKVGTSSPPTTTIWQEASSGGTVKTVFFPVLPNEYYELTDSGADTISHWHEYSWSSVAGTRYDLPTRKIYQTSSGIAPAGWSNSSGKTALAIVSATVSTTSSLTGSAGIADESTPAATTSTTGGSTVCSDSSSGSARVCYVQANPNETYGVWVDNGTATLVSWEEWTFN